MASTSLPWRWLAGPLCLALMAGTVLSHAGEEDHERARKALEAGEVLPLNTILERVERVYPGQVMDVELEREREGRGGRWIYEVKLLRPGGALVKLKVDARDGTVLGSQSRERPSGDRDHGRHRPPPGER